MGEKELEPGVNEYKKECKSSNYVKQLQWDTTVGLQKADNLKLFNYSENY